MKSIIIFIISTIIQTFTCTYYLINISKLYVKKFPTRNKEIILFIFILITVICSQLTKLKLQNLNVLISILMLCISLILIFKIDYFFSMTISIVASIFMGITELISVYLITNILNYDTSYLVNNQYGIFLIIIPQSLLFFIITKAIIYLLTYVNKRFNISINNITSKQIILFVVLLIIYIFPQMMLLITNQYDYSNLFLFISTIQFILIFIFISIFLKKSIDYDKNQKELYASELQNKTLFSLIDSINNLKHDFKNILSSFKGYINTKKYDKLEKHIDELLLEYDISNNFYSIDKKVFNEPAIYGLLGTKYYLATKFNILFEFKIDIDLTKINFSIPNLSRILGILIDNSIEATKDLSNPYIRLEMTYDKKRLADKIRVINTYNTNIEIDTKKIYEKGFSTKKVKSGIGLYEVKKIINKSKNSTINTTIENEMFIQTILIDK